LKINIYKSEEEVLVNLAIYFVAVANEAITATGRFSVALSGGSSPKKLYEILATSYRHDVEWSKVDFFFGDERDVPKDSADSNYLMVKKAIFDPLKINDEQVFAVNTTLEPDQAAAAYTKTIKTYFGVHAIKFNLVLLGLGDNSHTASLFPHTPVLRDNSVAVKAVFLTDQNGYRITFTAPMINQANKIAFLVYGAAKAIAVHHVIEDNKDIENYPAQLILSAEGDLQWFIDESASANLTAAAK